MPPKIHHKPAEKRPPKSCSENEKLQAINKDAKKGIQILLRVFVPSRLRVRIWNRSIADGLLVSAVPILILAATSVAQPLGGTTRPATTTATPTEPADPQAMLKAAFDLETKAYTTQSSEDFRAAADALETCSQQLPVNVKVERAAGFIYLDKLLDAERAYPHLEKAYAISPDEPGWAYSLAKAAGLIGKTDRQIAVLREAVKRNPNDKDAASALAEALAPTTSPATTTAVDKNAEMRQAAFALQTQAYTTQNHADYQTAAEAMEKCSQAIPNDLDVERSVGFLYLEKLRDPVRAYPHLEKAHSLAPDDASWASLLAKAAGEVDKYDRQIQVLTELVKRDPNDKDSASILAIALASKADRARAAETEKSAKMRQAAIALETQAYTTRAQADYEAAAEALQKCSEAIPNDLEVEGSVGFLYLEKLNNPARAYPHLERAHALSPNDAGWASLLAKAASQLGKTDRQIQVLRELLKRSPDNKESAASLAEALAVTTRPARNMATDDNAEARKAAFALETKAYTTQAQVDYQTAAEAFQKCLEVAPNDLEVQGSVGFLYLEKLNDPASAFPHLEKAYALSPNDIGWASQLAKAAGELGKTGRQIEVLRDLLKRDPNNKDSAAALAEALARTTNPATTKAAETNSDMRKAAFELETQAYTTQSQADYQAAADVMDKYSQAMPNDVEVERSVGFLYLDKLKDPARAYPHLERAYVFSPDDAGWGSLLAKAAGQLAKTDRQLAVLRDVVHRNPDNANSHLELAQALDKSGHHTDAGAEFQAAMKLAPDDEGIIIPYAQWLHARGRDIESKQLDDKVLARNPRSSTAMALSGDLHRSGWDLAQAQSDYQQALALDPESENAKTGLTEIHRNKYPTLDTSYYYFKGTDHFMQQGLYNTLSFSNSDHIYSSLAFNTGYFRDNPTRDPSVIRYQESYSIEDRIDNAISIRGGFEGFQQRRKEAFGFNLGATWKPTNELWVDASYHTEDPVTDSMYTVSNALSQDILAFTGGYQFSDDLALKFAASRSEYSDNVGREYIHIEPAYTLWQAMQLKLGAEYETVRYSKQLPGAGGVSWYNTYGPVVEVEPPITDWLSLHARAEFPYVPSANQWGSNLSLELKFHPGEHLTIKGGVFYVAVPESISSYSGSGFDASISYRF